jgi:hypothetical protein
MRCKKELNEYECNMIEEKKCLVRGVTTKSYESCMIAYKEINGWNTTEFCEDHYSEYDKWTGILDPMLVQFH